MAVQQSSVVSIPMWMMLMHLHVNKNKKNNDDVRGLSFGMNFHLLLYIMFKSSEGLITRFQWPNLQRATTRKNKNLFLLNFNRYSTHHPLSADHV